MVLRTVSPELSAIMKKWGAGPSFLTGAELYMALQRGTLQGGIASSASYVERKWYEVSPYFIMLPYGSVHNFLAVNKSFFDRLTPAQQKAIKDAGAIMDKKNYEIAMASMARDVAEVKKKGHLYVPTDAELAKWAEGSEEIWAEVARNSKDVADTLTKIRALLKR
jgi:C4-dicarboxylate-binding protein DctP